MPHKYRCRPHAWSDLMRMLIHQPASADPYWSRRYFSMKDWSGWSWTLHHVQEEFKGSTWISNSGSLSLFLLRHLQLTRAKGVQHTMTISYNHFQPLKTEPERSISTPLRLSSWMCIPTIITHGHSLDPLQTGMHTQGLLDSCQHKGTRQNWVVSKLHCRYK